MDPLDREMRQSADALVHRLARVGVELRYDREGIVALDAYVAENRALWSADDRARLSTELAAFVGECMVQTWGLPWARALDGKVVVCVPSGAFASPFARVAQWLAGEATPTGFFDEVGAELVRRGVPI